MKLENYDFEKLYDLQVRRIQERLKEQDNRDDCFEGREISYCSIYGTSVCNKKCKYAKIQEICEK